MAPRGGQREYGDIPMDYTVAPDAPAFLRRLSVPPALSDTLRWLGTMGLAGALAAMALWFTGALALQGKEIPQVLVGFDGLAAGAFFSIVGGMAGARASQNSQQISAGQAPRGT